MSLGPLVKSYLSVVGLTTILSPIAKMQIGTKLVLKTIVLAQPNWLSATERRRIYAAMSSALLYYCCLQVFS